MKRALVIAIVLFMVAFASVAYAETSVLNWDAPTMNTDGTPLTDGAGYNVYSKTDPAATYVKVGNTNWATRTFTHSVTIPNNTKVTYYYVVTSYDTSNLESGYSNEVSKTFFGVDTVAPKALTTLKVQ